MKILLLGRTGQLGAALAPALARLGDVIALDRMALDLANCKAIPIVVDRYRPDLVVNAAAYTAVDRAESDVATALTVNGAAPGILAEAAAARGAALLHFSTDYVFDGTSASPYREIDPTGPLSVYGLGKATGERAIVASQVPHLILRTSWLYGARGTNFLTTMLRLGAERETIRVVADQWGAPTPVAVVVDAVVAILRQAGDRPVQFLATQGGLCHLACRGRTSWHGFARAIFEDGRRRGLTFTVGSVQAIGTSGYPTAARRPANSLFDLTRLRERYGIETPDWRNALSRVMDDVAQCKGGDPAVLDPASVR